MRTLWWPYPWIFISLAVLILAGCQGSQPEPSQQNRTDENDTLQEIESDPDVHSEPDLTTETSDEPMRGYENLVTSVAFSQSDTIDYQAIDQNSYQELKNYIEWSRNYASQKKFDSANKYVILT